MRTNRHDVARRAKGEEGAGLIIALVVIVVIGFAAAALATFGNVSFRLTQSVRSERSAQYAADGAVEAAINNIRGNADLGVSGGSSCDYSAPPINNTSVTVSCTPTANSGGPGAVNQPRFAVLALSTNAAEGIEFTGNDPIYIGGGLFSNSLMTRGNNGNFIHVRGNITAKDPTCTADDRILAEKGGVKTCGYTGANQADPGYVPDQPTAPSGPQPAPDCTTYQKVVAFSPGKYTTAPAASGGPCNNKTIWWFKPGSYYFDLGGIWNLNNSIVAGTPSGWDPTSAATGTPPLNGTDCKADDLSSPGVQFVFGGSSGLDLQNNQIGFVMCAPPKASTGPPGPGTQEIALFQPAADGNGYKGASGCMTAQPYTGSGGTCAFIHFLNKPNVFVYGTTYAPASALDLQLHNLNVTLLNRGIIARTISIDVNASNNSTAETISLPFNRGPREVVLVAKATIGGVLRTLLTADIGFDDGVIGESSGGSPGRVVSVKTWSVPK
jgi:hypothetical protein